MTWTGWTELLTWPNLRYLAQGLWVTIQISVLSLAISLAIGTILSIWHTAAKPVFSWPVSVYVLLFRNVPLLVLVFFLAFGLPYVGIRLDPVVAATVGFTMYNSAMVSEALRGSIASISKSQLEAGLAQGLKRLEVYRFILLPQAFVWAIPTLIGQAIVLVQGTTLVSAIGVQELTLASTTISTRIGNPLETVVFIGVVYYLVSMLLSRARDSLEGRIHRRFVN